MAEPSAVTPRPYRMHNQIQNYAWGTRGPNAFIPRLLGTTPEPDVPYAELWLGAHPKAPSTVELDNGDTMQLDTWIAQNREATLGAAVAARWGELPFLLKVLSAGEALSIQAHPSKEQAEMLHAQDPAHYPDDNHKPEIAIALDGLEALVGFKPFDRLVETLTEYPEIAEFIGATNADPMLSAEAPTPEEALQLTHALFAALIRRAIQEPNAFAAAVDRLTERLSDTFGGLTEAELRFLDLRQQYGSQDVGIFTLFLLNLTNLSPGEGIYTDAGVPHAYLKGNIVECMANSDNVVRVGLTPKFKDAETLLKIVDAAPRTPRILAGNAQVRHQGVIAATYPTPAPEFELRRWRFASGTDYTLNKGRGPAILLVTDGSVELSWGNAHTDFRRGESAFLPANLSRLAMHVIQGAEVFLALVPEAEA